MDKSDRRRSAEAYRKRIGRTAQNGKATDLPVSRWNGNTHSNGIRQDK